MTEAKINLLSTPAELCKSRCPHTGSSSKMQICMEGISSGEAQVQLNCTKSAKPLTHWTVNQLSANSCSEWWRQGVFWNEIAAHFLCFKLIVHACQKYICLFHIKVLLICWQQHRHNYGHVLCQCLFHGNWTLQYHRGKHYFVSFIEFRWNSPIYTLCHFWWNAMICFCWQILPNWS